LLSNPARTAESAQRPEEGRGKERKKEKKESAKLIAQKKKKKGGSLIGP